MRLRQKINETFSSIAQNIINLGISLNQNAVKDIYLEIHPFGKLRDIFDNLGFRHLPVSTLDFNYAFTNEATAMKIWDQIVLFTTKLMYIVDYWDCDNFAHLAGILGGLLYKLNTIGVAYGTVYDSRTGALIGRHYFNIFATSEGKLFCGEPINGHIQEIERGIPIITPYGWEYKIESVRFF